MSVDRHDLVVMLAQGNTRSGWCRDSMTLPIAWHENQGIVSGDIVAVLPADDNLKASPIDGDGFDQATASAGTVPDRTTALLGTVPDGECGRQF